MGLIFTTKGDIEEDTLVKTEGVVDNEIEYTTWQAWHLDGELVKREAQVQLKIPAEMSGEVSTFE
jgi:hypothetical protein